MAKENQSKKSIYSQKEEEILDFWRENKIFEKSVEKPAPRGNYVFYDGPPFITGLPHYATLLPSIAKDIVPRYFTMKGYRVERVWGWDCHGIPAENKVEENLGLKNKKDIEKLGVGEFVNACREYVSTSSKQWEWYIERIARWVDMKNAYKTMDLKFMESVIWAFKELYQKELIYEGYRTSLHCPRCATPLSKFEVTMDAGSYRNVEDDSVIVEFQTEEDFSLLAWTTTPWTLPGNMALAVGEKIDYVLLESEGKKYVLAKEKAEEVFEGKNFKVIKKMKGKELAGLKYEPIFDLRNEEIKESEAVFKVYLAGFVNTEEGTGIVHVAPNFGEDDFLLGQKAGLPIIELMDENGIYTENAGEWKGLYFKKAGEKALEELAYRKKLFSRKKSVHSYPFCHRCNTELMHKTQKAWYLKIDSVRRKMVESNKEINWVPDHFGEGRFRYNLENAPDWCLSRSRYWGSPIPVWKCQGECNNLKVVGSLDELKELSGKEVDDLHRPKIDKVTFGCEKCGGKMKRVPEVLDCWFESGSMPFAQFHYPFEKKEKWEDLFPADFIIEYTGQLRGWFYYLHVLSNALFNSVAFKNVIVTGVLAGDDGRKMSKSLGNYPDPRIVLDKYGGDALRIYFMSSPLMLGGDANLSESDIQDSLRKNVILLSNVLNFYKPFAAEKNYFLTEKDLKTPESENVLDRWIIARLNETVEKIAEGMENYTLPPVCHAVTHFINDLSTWYIRRSRKRFKEKGEKNARETTGFVLFQFAKAIAPVMPFLGESVWQEVTGKEFREKEESVHLSVFPSFDKKLIDRKLLFEMEKVREVVSLALKERAEAGIKVRQPLSSLRIPALSLKIKERKEEMIGLIKEEVNVKEVVLDKKMKEGVILRTEVTPELEKEGAVREIVRAVQAMRKEAGLTPKDSVTLFYNADEFDSLFSEWREYLKKETGAEEIIKKEPDNFLAKKTIKIKGKDLGVCISGK